MRGWLNYYSIADMKRNIEDLNGWLYRRIRMCIWKQWKLPRTRMRKLIGLGVASHYAATIANDRKGCWIVRRGDKQIKIKKGLPQSFKGYDSNGYSLFYAVTTV